MAQNKQRFTHDAQQKSVTLLGSRSPPTVKKGETRVGNSKKWRIEGDRSSAGDFASSPSPPVAISELEAGGTSISSCSVYIPIY